MYIPLMQVNDERIWAIGEGIGLHLLEVKERIVVLDVRRIGGSENVEVEYR